MSIIRIFNASVELWGAVICLIGLFCVLVTGKANQKFRQYFASIFVAEGIALFSDAMATIFRGKLTLTAIVGVRLFNFLGFTFNYVVLAVLSSYFMMSIEQNGHGEKLTLKWKKIVWLFCGFAVLMIVVNLFTGMFYYIDENNLYTRGDYFWMTHVYAIIIDGINLFYLIKYRDLLRKTEFAVFIMYTVVPLAAIVVQIFMYGLALLNIVTSVSIIILFLTMQSSMAKRISTQEVELMEIRTKVMVSQIQPHFLYNALTAILGIEGNPPETKQAIVDFSKYLRGNIDSLNENEPITFEKELQHIKTYTRLELLRFGDEVEIEYDIETDNFRVPALTVQMMVENAIKHGITQKRGGGKVILSTRETEDAFVVTVSDNGVGFDVTKPPAKDGRSHVGLEGARKRVENMSGGTLTITSVIGEGSVATITIPKIK